MGTPLTNYSKPKIEVKNTAIVINDYTLGDCYNKIERFFSVWDKLYHKAYPKGIKYDKQTKCLYLPRGIDIPMLENAFGVNIDSHSLYFYGTKKD